MPRMGCGFLCFLKAAILYVVGHFAISHFGEHFVNKRSGYEKGTCRRFIAILNLQWAMIFCSLVIYRQLMAFFDSPFTLICTYLKPTSLTVEIYRRRVANVLLLFFLLSHLTYFLYYFDGLIQWLLFEISSICLGVWAHLMFFCFGFFALNCVLPFLKGVDCFSNLLEKLARISFIRLLLWNRQFQAVFSLIVSVCISLVCFMSADYIYVRTAELPISNLSPKAEGLRIAVLSDLHAGGAVHRDQIAHVVDRTNDMNADAVFIVGDMTDGTIEHLESRIEPLRHLRSRLGTFMVTGNHDYYFDDALAWIRLFKSYGIKVLTNSKADLEGICLVGLNDISSGTSGIPSHEMNISSVILECEASKSVIVLSHNPASAKHISESNLSYNGVDLIISGHTHSGQFYVMLPFIYFVLPYVHGLYTVPMKFVSHNTILLVTAGTLYQGPPMKMPFYSNIWQVTLMAKRTSEFVDLD
ncbi:hypothetical protein QR680_009155 [Steinernema hermaphroditum]|uniref:Calcineurin-like phosphoesterase domain-containing protein n=1 Tax=Steinernema hermaphroditum TaxID=289476 RepID=A0AA39ILL9_9BILA|nr:hypothetical protein QR680_009155 [Steinernema hermaphroditum]